MKKKILFAVMALLVMATGNVLAQKAYAVFYPSDNSMHFVYTNEQPTDGTCWEINSSTTPAWYSLTEKNLITKVVFEESFKGFKGTTCSYWFYGFNELKEIIGIDNLETSEVTNMCDMFDGCRSLTSLDLSNFNTSQVKDMSYMFYNCSSLTSLDLSSFNTSQVTTMKAMFGYCTKLTNLTLSDSFITSSVTNLQNMFNNCKRLVSLDLSSFDTSQVKDMSSMFFRCSDLTSLDLSNFNTSQVTTMSTMFNECSSLTNLTLSKNFTTSSVKNMMYMFKDCSSLASLDLSSFDISNVENMSDMFSGCNNNAFVFLTAETQEKIADKIENMKYIVVKNTDGVYTYNGAVEINSENYKESPLDIPYGFTASSVTFTRDFTANKPQTVCLPFAVTNTADYGEFYDYSNYDEAANTVKFTKVEETVANKPYLFIPAKDITEIKSTGVDGNDGTISSTASMQYADTDCLIGVYAKKTFTEEEVSGEGFVYYGWTSTGNGEFRKAGAGAYVYPCRAYLRLPKVQAYSAPARLSVLFGGDITGISTAVSDADSGTNAPMYNLQGQRVDSSYRGVVIKNGRKIAVK